MASETASAPGGHYGVADLRSRIDEALVVAGLGAGPISWDQLVALDQFHTGGLRMSRRLAGGLDLHPESQVLDIGSGLGGAARFLASTYGCHVTGVDLTEAFVDVAIELSARASLAGWTAFRQADALALPFADGAFDRALSQHVAMNIADRARLYAEAHRVLRPGALIGLHDVTQGHGGPLRYPVPWARGPETSFLLTAEEMRSTLARTGFTELSFVDLTDQTLEEAGRRRPAKDGTPQPPLRLDVVMGPDFQVMGANLRRNLEEGRARVVQMIERRD
ncbi:MAG: class I SAM-dependent methyltransferase [Candidatus Dormibacteraceae bacterium]